MLRLPRNLPVRTPFGDTDDAIAPLHGDDFDTMSCLRTSTSWRSSLLAVR